MPSEPAEELEVPLMVSIKSSADGKVGSRCGGILVALWCVYRSREKFIGASFLALQIGV